MHPVYGHELLLERGDLSPMALDVVLHHHEKIDGSGYPDGINAHDLNVVTRVVTIADIFDALTTRRTYKKALSTFDALTLMREEMKTEIDQDLYKVFIELLGAPEG